MKGLCGCEYVPEECFKCAKRKLCAEKEKALQGSGGETEKKVKKKKAVS